MMTSDQEAKAVPCRFCGLPTTYLGTRQCRLCWEVDSRIEEFVRSAAGRARVLEALLRQQQRESSRSERQSTDEDSDR